MAQESNRDERLRQLEAEVEADMAALRAKRSAQEEEGRAGADRRATGLEAQVEAEARATTEDPASTDLVERAPSLPARSEARRKLKRKILYAAGAGLLGLFLLKNLGALLLIGIVLGAGYYALDRVLPDEGKDGGD